MDYEHLQPHLGVLIAPFGPVMWRAGLPLHLESQMFALVLLEVYHGKTYLYVPAWLLKVHGLGWVGVWPSVWGAVRAVKVNKEVSSHEVCRRVCLFLLSQFGYDCMEYWIERRGW